MKFVISLALVVSTAVTAAPALHPQEKLEANEAKNIAKITAIISAGVKAQHKAAKDGVATRDAHAKHHGCVNATFTVLDKLPAAYAVGLFDKAKSYEAIIRYSNGMGKVQDDREGDARGMAVKVLGVPGDKILEDEKNEKTQDFLMINHPVFFVKNVADYVQFSEALGSGSPLSFFLSWNPFKWHIKEMRIAQAIRGNVVTNPLAARYFSMTPVLMGNTPAKYSATPCKGQKYAKVAPQDNQLRAAMKEDLRPDLDDTKKVCFEFGVQLQNDPRNMPVEDPRIEWNEKKSKYFPVAKIEIGRQEFTTKAQLDACENLSFTPWHSLPEHRPIGAIQRARKSIYQTISALRHDLNKVPRREP